MVVEGETENVMSFKFKIGGLITVAVTAALVLVAMTLLSPTTPADAQNQNSLVGTWRVTVCFPGTNFEVCEAATSTDPEFLLYTYYIFHEDNTMTEEDDSPRNGTSAGVWGLASDSFAATFEDWDFPSNKPQASSRFRVRLTIQVDGDSFTATATGDDLTQDGDFDGTFITDARVVGERMVVIPE